MPPENAGYMVAAYVVVAVLLLGYAISLYVRIRKATRGSGAPPEPL
jgi:hypothetical protein